ncbi:hypothetical protein AAG906_027966 [Vitis piasezkii]
MSQNVETSRHFIDLCLQEANKGFRSSGGLKSSVWPRIVEKLEKLLGKHYTSKQLKNGWDYMKRQYLIWSKMMTMIRHGYNFKYPEAKQFCFKPLENVEELQVLFRGLGGVIAFRVEESSTHSTSMPSETPISLEEDENLPRNTNDEVQGPSMKECMKILKRLLTYEDPLYYVAINAFCKKKEYGKVWVEMESDQERMRWI